MTDVYVPAKSQLELCFYNSFRQTIEMYTTDTNTENISSNNEIIKTGHIKVYSDVIRNFLKTDENIPFLLIGPSGAGKRFEYEILST